MVVGTCVRARPLRNIEFKEISNAMRCDAMRAHGDRSLTFRQPPPYAHPQSHPAIYPRTQPAN